MTNMRRSLGHVLGIVAIGAVAAALVGTGPGIAVPDRASAATTVAVAADSTARVETLPVDTSLTTLFLVRHAEKNTIFLGEDPPLTDVGTRRAEALAHTLADVGITAIYSTHFRRNRDTGLPLAKLLGDTLRIVSQLPYDRFARRIVEENRGGRVLVVGHSDTVPQILEQLLGLPAKTFPGAEHDLIYVVTIPRNGRASVMKVRFGEPIPRTP